MKRDAIQRCLAMITVTLMVACGGFSGSDASDPSTLYITSSSDPKSFNPVTARETSTTDLLGFIFESLVKTNAATYAIEPQLADTWSVSPDGTKWTFHLRRDVKWSDGVPLTADDVLFSYKDLVFNPKVGGGMADLLQVDGKAFTIEKIDTWTVIFNTHKPFAPFLRSIGASILPVHRYGEIEDFNQALGINTPLDQVVGTGPYCLQEFVPGQRVVLTANPHYWGRDTAGRPLPRLSRVVINTVSDLDAEMEWFKAGRSDFSMVRGKDWTVLAMNPRGYTMHNLGPRFATAFVFFNQNLAAPIDEKKKFWFRDRNFREAVAWAVDRPTIIDAIYNGLAFAGQSEVPEANKLFYDSSVTQYAYDIARGRRILAEAGYTWTSAGDLLDPKGRPVAFEIMTNSENNERVRVATLIAEGCRQLGMKVNVNALSFNTLVEKLDTSFDWEGCLLGLTAGLEPHNGSNIWRVEGDMHMFNQQPREPMADAAPEVKARYQERLRLWRKGIQPYERQIEMLMQEGSQVLDPRQRFAVYSRMQHLVSHELPFIYTVVPAALYATRDRIDGFAPSAIGQTPVTACLHNIEYLRVK